ncbi:Proteasome lid subunit RPN8/RPN11, contains Jab1/MPN metalloenzyme (JAMM) motif [Candidatus Electrothrix aarhusensis]|jgi:proteasome lid subunit RPN8/RPN11|uniref:Proteasome lid subunit RPN8/RPN11, contains Jab1/MPN metalloenzyme (JAMM) motif n=1 Tax=Candidatus Electrothrix aarhusensis TaxID=1859131 RepID=A0A444IZE6_9BACT|nr:Proteasome lid subunit RPN8/RPN11, contains Jab1/MPN metalloenzyme (JAMM) motif [Candidatus Electrothrix aarhusensis]
MEFKITRQVLSGMVAHSREVAPCEACGYLAERNGLVEQMFRLTNVDQAPDHFSMDPAEQFSAIREMRDQGLRLRAVYHSHPETPARPSPEDIRHAIDPHISYLIISLLTCKRPVRSFRIQQGVLKEETMVIS